MKNLEPAYEMLQIRKSQYIALIDAAESARDLIDRVRTRLRPQPSTMRVSDRPLVEIARAELDTAYDLLQKALLPW